MVGWARSDIMVTGANTQLDSKVVGFFYKNSFISSLGIFGNFLGGDYGVHVKAKGSESLITLNRLYPEINQ
jgi:hypothetical protein